MTPERWHQIRAVLEGAEFLTGAELESYLDAACAGDPDLRAEVDSLLRARLRAGTAFLETPAADLMGQGGTAVATPSRVGRQIGAFRVVDEIGAGGMGEVYRAVRADGQFHQQVAIKFVRIGFGSAFLMERFMHERQILATLNHPNIAHLLDGGATEDGVPYLVMELVTGVRIDTYCQSNHLSVTARLQLFLHVCDAVEHAHQRLVIHRDIKPGNILVTSEGIPKLLDFGIAKILDPARDAEMTLARSMTPQYASPEQITGQPITTATDVYTLAVVLYRLLTGRSPYRFSAATASQWTHAITGTEPQRPSSAVDAPMSSDLESAAENDVANNAVLNPREPTCARLRRRLSGDIDSILLKALRKEPERRYRTVREFADDLQRHLNGLPVNATKGSWTYSARKFTARHRTAAAAALLTVLALLAGIVATERQARIARAERARAQKRFDDVRAFSNALIFDVHDALQDVPGTTPARNLLLDRAVQYLDRVSADAQGDPDLERELASAYQRVATVQGDATTSNLGQVSASKISYGKATALFEAVARAKPASTADQLSVAQIYRQQAVADLYYPEGRPEIDKALAVTDRLMRTDGQNSKVQIERAMEQQVLAAKFDIDGERSHSVDLYRQSLDLVLAVAEREPAYKNIAERAAKNKVLLGFELAHTSAVEEGQKHIQAGISAYDEVLRRTSRPDTQRDRAASRYRLGYVQALRGDLPRAIATFTRVSADETPLARADPQNLTFKVDLLSVDFELQRLLLLNHRYARAEVGLLKNIAAFRALNAEEDSGPGIGVLYAWLGEAQFGEGKFEQALKSFRTSAQELEKIGSDDDTVCGLVTENARIGDTLVKLGRSAGAASAYKAALAKIDEDGAIRRSDLPALMALVAARGGIARLKFASASAAHKIPDREQLRDACNEYSRAHHVSEHIPVALKFNPANFPNVQQPNPPKACTTLAEP